ncbi:ATP-binding protein [Streptomyces sp. NPDC002467]|uniref:ATP-binding protein n=1 Tax=Streptomyces sp. NPDC002467 TaxID=3364647 RepID=UPI00368AC920
MGTPPSPPPALPHRELEFGSEAVGACGAGIAWVRRTLDDWHLPATRSGDAVLVAAELLSNAAQHAGGILRLFLEHHGNVPRITVSDPSPEPPRPGEHRPEAIGGHGLFLVDRLTVDWGTRREDGGETVWADLPLRSPDGSVASRTRGRCPTRHDGTGETNRPRYPAAPRIPSETGARQDAAGAGWMPPNTGPVAGAAAAAPDRAKSALRLMPCSSPSY